MKNRRESGAIIVEASVAIPIFMFLILIILSITNICLAQAKIQIAVNSAAKEVSEYCYLYGLTGLNEKQKELYEKTLSADADIKSVLSGLSDVSNSVSSAKGAVSNTIQDPSTAEKSAKTVMEAYDQGKAGASQVSDTVKGIMDDPQNFFMGVAAIIGNGAIEEVKSHLGAIMAKALCQKNLRTEKENCEQFLKRMGVCPKNGSYYDGIDFTDSRFCLNGSAVIAISAKYQIRVLNFFNQDIKFNFENTGTTYAWFGDTNNNAKDEGAEEGNNEATQDTPDKNK